MILGYDNWKTSPPEEPEPVYECEQCGRGLYDGDECYEINRETLCAYCGQSLYVKIV